MKLNNGGLKVNDGLKLPQQNNMMSYHQSNSTTPKPPQIGGVNFNPYRENMPNIGGVLQNNMPTVTGKVINNSINKDVSPLATYEKEQAHQRIF